MATTKKGSPLVKDFIFNTPKRLASNTNQKAKQIRQIQIAPYRKLSVNSPQVTPNQSPARRRKASDFTPTSLTPQKSNSPSLVDKEKYLPYIYAQHGVSCISDVAYDNYTSFSSPTVLQRKKTTQDIFASGIESTSSIIKIKTFS